MKKLVCFLLAVMLLTGAEMMHKTFYADCNKQRGLLCGSCGKSQRKLTEKCFASEVKTDIM